MKRIPIMISRPKSRTEMERNMHITCERFEKNSIKINASMHRVIRGLEQTQLLPNQRANLLTVDEMSRLYANSIANFSMMEDAGFEF